MTVYKACTYQSDMISQMNPSAGNVDKFYHFPICPREETSNDGMLMTSATLHESFGLIDKVKDAEFAFDNNAENRKISESLSSRTGNANQDDIEMTHSPSELEARQQLSEESIIEEATEGLKHLRNMKRKKFNKLGLTDPFISGAILLKKSIKKQCEKALQKEKREHEIINLAVKYFKRQMKYRRRILDKAMAHQKMKSFKQHVPEYKLHFLVIMERKRRNDASSRK